MKPGMCSRSTCEHNGVFHRRDTGCLIKGCDCLLFVNPARVQKDTSVSGWSGVNAPTSTDQGAKAVRDLTFLGPAMNASCA